jgi:hypothetical protein
MQIGELFDDGQAEPEAAGAVSAGGMLEAEPIKNAR